MFPYSHSQTHTIQYKIYTAYFYSFCVYLFVYIIDKWDDTFSCSYQRSSLYVYMRKIEKAEKKRVESKRDKASHIKEKENPLDT